MLKNKLIKIDKDKNRKKYNFQWNINMLVKVHPYWWTDNNK